jgi:DNA-directed RNA polymerase alpha subunit
MSTPPDDTDHQVIPLPRSAALGDALGSSLLSPRLLKVLNKAGIRTLEDLLALSWDEVRAIRGLGMYLERELMHALRAEGLHLRDHQDDVAPREVEPGDLVTDIATLDLDGRTIEVLKAGGVATVGDLLDKRRSDLLRIQGVGEATYLQIRAAVQARGWVLPRFNRVAAWHGRRPRRGDPSTPLWNAYCYGYLPARGESVLHGLGLKTVGEVAAMTVPEIEALHGIGPKTLTEIVHGMRRLGFSMRYKRP